MREHTQINNLQEKGIYTGKTLYGKYLDAVGNIGSYLTIFVTHDVYISARYYFYHIEKES